MQRNGRNFTPAAEPPKAPGKPTGAQSVPMMGNELGAQAPQVVPQAPVATVPVAQSSLGRAISHLGGK